MAEETVGKADKEGRELGRDEIRTVGTLDGRAAVGNEEEDFGNIEGNFVEDTEVEAALINDGDLLIDGMFDETGDVVVVGIIDDL